MKFVFKDKLITSMLGVVPDEESFFDDEVNNYSFPVNQTMRLKKVMGFNKHRLSKPESTVSDFAVQGIEYMLQNSWIEKEEIGAVIVVTLCPDFFVPHISNIIHDRFRLGTDVLCVDLSQGCCGFIQGLMESFLIQEHMSDKKVLLINGDLLSHKVSKRDRNDFPLIGDAVTISVIENGVSDDIYLELNTDGSGKDALIIPAGGFRTPSDATTCVMTDQGDGNFRSLDNIHMDGAAVFNFVQREVPPMLERVFAEQGVKTDDFDLFLFHQPNKFMLKKLAEKVGIPEDRLPMNLVENYGNSSGACIPLTTVLNCREEMKNKKNKCCLSAFGSGLTWGVVIITLGNFKNCDMIEIPY